MCVRIYVCKCMYVCTYVRAYACMHVCAKIPESISETTRCHHSPIALWKRSSTRRCFSLHKGFHWAHSGGTKCSSGIAWRRWKRLREITTRACHKPLSAYAYTTSKQWKIWRRLARGRILSKDAYCQSQKHAGKHSKPGRYSNFSHLHV